ncbi:toxin glutamine deamidase domain-containing protein [Actinophytocola sp. NPDC049390]|uniref:WXG100-like domain-containing protein n=1 Tax=Actinophytocola sp. NPDC049390 TaxID=3363894 RepID=UPI00379FE7C9
MGFDVGGWAGRLFDDVCDFFSSDDMWPPDEPADARACGDAWGRAGDALQTVADGIVQSAKDIFLAWSDSVGYQFHVSLLAFGNGIGGLAGNCRELKDFCYRYAEQIEQQRWAVRLEMIINAASYALIFTGAGSMAGALAGAFARKVGAQVMGMLAKRAASLGISAGTRSAVKTVALKGAAVAKPVVNFGKDVVEEGVEEGVISYGSQKLATGEVDSTQLKTDVLAGVIGGGLAHVPGKVVNRVAPTLTGDVSKHVRAAVGGGVLNAGTSPVAGVMAHDIVEGNGISTDLGVYGRSILENGDDAFRSGVLRANGNVLAGQVGSLPHMPANADVQMGLLDRFGPDGPPPNPPPNPPSAAAPDATVSAGSSGAADSGLTGDGASGTSGLQGTSGSLGAVGAGNPGTTGTTSGGDGSARASAPGRATAPGGGHDAGPARSSSTLDAPASEVDTETTDPAGTAGNDSAGEQADGTNGQPGTGERSAEHTGDTTGQQTTQHQDSEQQRQGEQQGQRHTTLAADAESTGPAQSSDTGGQTDAAAGVASPPPATTQTGHATHHARGRKGGTDTSAAGEPPATTEAAEDVTPEPGTRPRDGGPVEITASAWQGMPPQVRDAVTELFARQETSQVVRNTVARLVGTPVADTTKLEIMAMANSRPDAVLNALTDIAERAPGAVDGAMEMARRNRASANDGIRRLRNAVLRGNGTAPATQADEESSAPTEAAPVATAGRPGTPGFGAAPDGIAPDVWRSLSQDVRDAIHTLLANPPALTHEQMGVLKEQVARLAGLNVPNEVKLEVVRYADRFQPADGLRSLINLAEKGHGSLAYATAIELARRHPRRANSLARRIWEAFDRPGATALNSLLAKLGRPSPAPPEGDETPDDAREETETTASGSGPDGSAPDETEASAGAGGPETTAEQDAGGATTPSARADVPAPDRTTLDGIANGLASAADQAAHTFHVRPFQDGPVADEAAKPVYTALVAARQASRARREAQRDGAIDAIVEKLRTAERAAWDDYRTIRDNAADRVVNALFHGALNRAHDTLLGDLATDHRLRASGTGVVLEHRSPDGAWHLVHTFPAEVRPIGIGSDIWYGLPGPVRAEIGDVRTRLGPDALRVLAELAVRVPGSTAFRVALELARHVNTTGLVVEFAALAADDPAALDARLAEVGVRSFRATARPEPAGTPPRGISAANWSALSQDARDAVSDVFAGTPTGQVRGAIYQVVKSRDLTADVKADILARARDLPADVMNTVREIAEDAPGSVASETAIEVARTDPADSHGHIGQIKALLPGPAKELREYLDEHGLSPAETVVGLPPVDDVAAVLVARGRADTAGTIGTLPRKLSRDLIAGYLANIAASVTGTEIAAADLAERLAAMTTTQLDTFCVQVARVAARPTLTTAAKGNPADPITPARAGATPAGRTLVQEAGVVHRKLEQLAGHDVDVSEARKTLDGVMSNVDLHLWGNDGVMSEHALSRSAKTLLGLFSEADAALALIEMPQHLRDELGLTDLDVTGVRVGKDPDADIAATLPDGREVRIEVKDYHAFSVGDDQYQGISGQFGDHRAAMPADGVLIVLLTNDEMTVAERERVRRQTVFPRPGDRHVVADALVADGADMVLRYDGFDTFSALSGEIPPAPNKNDDGDPPNDPPPPTGPPEEGPPPGDAGPDPADGNADGNADDRPAGEIAAPEAMPLLSRVFLPERHSARLRGIGQAVLRGADRIAGMRAVTPLPGDSGAYRIHYGEGQHDNFVATVEVADLGDTVAARHTTDFRGDVRIVVSSRARPTAVPLLVAAALAEAEADRAGDGLATDDVLVRGKTSGDPLLSVRDRMNAAQLLACDHLLRQDPLLRPVRAQLRALVTEMGLDPDQKGKSADVDVLPTRVRTVVERHTVAIDGQLRVRSYLFKALLSEVPVAALMIGLAFTTALVPGAVALTVVSASVARALAHALFDRWVAMREDLATDDYFGERHEQLTADATTNDSLRILREFVLARNPANAFDEHVVARDGTTPVDLGGHQLRRVYGLRRGVGTLAATSAIGLVLIASQVVDLPNLFYAVAGMLLSLTVQNLLGPFLDAYKRQVIIAWKGARQNAQLARLNDIRSGRAPASVDEETDYVAAVRRDLEKAAATVGAPTWLGWLYSDSAAAQLGRILQPRAPEHDVDRNVIADELSRQWENGGFRSALVAALLVWNPTVAHAVFGAGQDERARRKANELATEAELDKANLDAILANIRGEPAPPMPESTPLQTDPSHPSGLPSARWPTLLAAVGLLSLSVAIVMDGAFGLHNLPWFYAAGALGPALDAVADRITTGKELAAGGTKTDLARAAAVGMRTTRQEAFAAFWQDVRSDTRWDRGVVGDPRYDDPAAGEIRAARDRAYWALVDQVRALADDPATRHTPPVELARTLEDRVVALHGIDGKVEKWIRVSGVAHRGQERAERVVRDELIAAIRKYNEIDGITAPIPTAALFEGGGTDGVPFTGLPVLPAGTNGQAAAVTLDRHFRHPGVPYQAPADLTTHAGNTAWDDRVAAAAGVPGQRFQTVGTVNDVVERLTGLGAGSRAIVHVRQKDDNGVAVPGHLINAVNVGGTVHFLDARTGAPADLAALGGDVSTTGPGARTPGRALFDSLAVLITEDNGEHGAERLPMGAVSHTRGRASAAARAVGQRVGAVARDGVAGSLLTDRAAPGLTAPANPHSVPEGLGRIAAVINPGRHLPPPANAAAPDPLPAIRAFSDQWDEEELPEPDHTDLAIARDMAELAVVLLRESAGHDVTGTPEFRRLADLLGRPDAPPTEVRDAMAALAVVVMLADGVVPRDNGVSIPSPDEKPRATVGQADEQGRENVASTVDGPGRGAGADGGGGGRRGR